MKQSYPTLGTHAFCRKKYNKQSSLVASFDNLYLPTSPSGRPERAGAAAQHALVLVVLVVSLLLLSILTYNPLFDQFLQSLSEEHW